jgi:4-amino-4-deoxy-L-arabinose transferase-like glycosyltransferase
LQVLAGFVLLTLVMRFFSFFPSLISHDESTYLVIARELLQGKIYFVDLIDTKPIGIFLILGAFISITGKSIFLIRMITAVIIALTAFTVYKISLYNHGERKAAIASGIILVFYLSVYTFYGVFVNPELFFLLFTALAFYLFIRSKHVLSFFLIGLLMGTGFMIKYVVLFDLAAFLLFYLVTVIYRKNRRQILQCIGNCTLAVFGFLIPLAITIYYYYRVGHLHEFLFYTFEVTGNYPVERSLVQALLFTGDFHLRFLPITFFFYFALFKTNPAKDKDIIPRPLIITWCLMVLVVVLLPGKSFFHYFIQLMLPVSIVAGNFFRKDMSRPAWINKVIGKPVGAALLCIAIVAQVLMQKHDYFDKPDTPREIAYFLENRMNPKDRLFAGNYHQLMYYLLDRDCPVRYVHRTLMCAEHHKKLLQIDVPAEMNRLMEQNIRFIIMDGPYCYEPMNRYIEDNYIKIKTFGNSIVVYERNP